MVRREKKSKKRKSYGGYHKRSQKSAEDRANQRGGNFDNPFKGAFKIWTPNDGSNRIRILPPTFEDAEHFGMDAYIHYGIGPDNQRYLCLQKMLSKKCPVCVESDRARRQEDEDYSKSISAKKRVVFWMIDRSKPEEGPQLYSAPWTLDRDIAAASIDPDSKEVLYIDHPDEGFDVLFRREGKGKQTNYVGVQVARRDSPISDDEDEQEEWLEYITENPISDTFEFFDADKISKAFSGVGKDEDEEEDEDERSSTRHGRTRRERVEEEEEEEEEKPPRSKRRQRVEKEDDGFRDEDFEEEEEEEEEKPPKKQRGGLRRRSR